MVDADIDAFFDSVDHEMLLQKVNKYIADKDIARLIESWIKAEVWDGNALTVTEKGIRRDRLYRRFLPIFFLMNWMRRC